MTVNIGVIGSVLFVLGILWGILLGVVFAPEFALIGGVIASIGMLLVAAFGGSKSEVERVEEQLMKHGSADEPWSQEAVEEILDDDE